jgi:hypothetical protein
MQDLMKALFKAADIGPQAPALDMEIVRERVEKAKAMHWNGGPAQLAELEKA